MELWLAASAILLLWIIYKYFTWNHDHFKKSGIPYVKPVPVFGNILDSMIGRKNLGEIFQDIYWKLDGYTFGGVFRFGEPAILIRDPELIKTVLVKDFTSFHDNDVFVDINTDPMFGRNPFALPGERWKIVRAQLMPAFTQLKIKPLFPLVDEVCQKLIEHIEKSGASVEIEAKELCAQFTTDVVGTCAFGIQSNSLHNPESEFRQMGREMIGPSFIHNIRILIILMIPWLANIFKIRLVTKKVEEFFRRIIQEVVTYREENNVTRNDYLQHLIALKQKSPLNENNGYVSLDKNVFTDVDVAAHAITFFGDGFETSASALSFTLYALATNPDVQIKAREEVLAVQKKYGGHLTFDGIQELKYLDLVLAESLRMYSPVMMISRLCTRPFSLETPSGSSYTVEAGTSVIIPVYALHYDPRYFPNPNVFDPERFTEDNKKDRNKYVYLPFGEGPRICMGIRFAMMQVKAGIASVISKFELKTTPRTPIRIVPDPNHFLLASKAGLSLQFCKIK